MHCSSAVEHFSNGFQARYKYIITMYMYMSCFKFFMHCNNAVEHFLMDLRRSISTLLPLPLPMPTRLRNESHCVRSLFLLLFIS